MLIIGMVIIVALICFLDRNKHVLNLDNED